MAELIAPGQAPFISLDLGEGGATLPGWKTFTPVWSASGTAPAIGNGILECSYLHIGKLLIAQLHFEAGSTTTFGTGTWRFTLPVQPILPDTSLVFAGGAAYLENNAIKGYPALSQFTNISSSWLMQLQHVASDGTGVLVTGTAPFAWADTDYWNTTIIYEVAEEGGGGGAEIVTAAFHEDYVGSANRINTTETIEKTMTFVIPAAWNSWDVQIAASWTVFEDLSATGNTFIRFRIRKTNVSGDVWGANAQTYADASPNDQAASFVAHAEGQTDTGTVTFVWTGDAGANSEIFAWDEFDLILTAYRVT